LTARQRFRSFLRFLTTPARRIDPTVRVPIRPSFVVATIVGLLFLEWWYFYGMLPYAIIPAKPVFWLAFVAWAISPVIAQWRWHALPTRQAVSLQGNFMIGFGITAIILAVSAGRLVALLPVVEALMPGAMAGGIVACAGSLFWQRNDHSSGPSHQKNS
jgi:hypothetical protein